MELPVKQEAFKCWLESYGIACGNIFGEVKRRGQHSKTFHVKVLSRQTAQVFLVLPGCFNCHVPAIGGSAQLYQFPIAADRGALTGHLWNSNNFFVDSVSLPIKSVLKQNK